MELKPIRTHKVKTERSNLLGKPLHSLAVFAFVFCFSPFVVVEIYKCYFLISFFIDSDIQKKIHDNTFYL